MKKTLLIITSAVVGASAFATIPVLEEAIVANDVKSEKLAVSETALKEKQDLSAAVSGPRKKFGPTSNGFTMYPVVAIPPVPFYMEGLTLSTGLSVAPLPIAPNNPVQFSRNIYARRSATATGTPPWDDVKVSWKYYDMFTGEEKTSTENAITVTYPAMEQLTTFKAPAMTATYQGTQSEDVVVPYTIAIGGQSILYIGHKDEEGNTVTGPYQLGFNTCPQGEGINYNKRQCQTCRFGTSGYSNRTDSFDDYLGEFAKGEYADAFKSATNGKTLAKATATGYGISMPYTGVPYLLKKLTFYAYTDLPKDVNATVTVYKADAKGNPTSEVVKTQNVVIPANKPDEGYVLRSDFPVTFTSKDEDGFDLDYMVIDSPLFIKVTGITNNSSIKSFSPWILGYDSELGYSYSSNSYTLFDLEGEGTTIKDVMWDNGTYSWGNDKDGYFAYKGAYVAVDAELPYLVPTLLSIGENNTAINYESTNDYKITIADGVESAMIQIATSASDADEILVNPENVPSNVKIGLASGIEYVQGTNLYNFIQVKFSLTSFKDQIVTLPIEYKNQKINISLINGTPASVGEIAVDNNSETVYYDLQGRVLKGAPEKGVYLVKEGGKVTKVIR